MAFFLIVVVLPAIIYGLAVYAKERRRQKSAKNKQAIRIDYDKAMRANNAYEYVNQVKEEKVSKIDPFNPRTYRGASSAQLIIFGLPIYRYGSGDNWTITRKPVTENDFVDWVRINIKKQNFRTPEEREKYYGDYVLWYYKSCDNSNNFYGGLKFTDAMLELSSHLSIEGKEKIGRIFCELLENDPRKYRFQQELFNKGTKVDPLFFSNVALAASFQVEQDQMAAYYHECEFDTEEEVYEFFNNSEYLKKYPRLKEIAIKDALKWKIGRK
jgi:hypothetical protein